MNSREKRAKINIVVSLVCQIITLICGLVVPQLFIRNYGSEAYGTTSSISQFLAYISLLEGGVAGVARSALYKPIAEDDSDRINVVLYEIRHFFRIIGYVFIAYVLILACSFKYISNVQVFSWIETFILVIVISISTFAQYFIGISYSVLLQSSQRQYVSNLINISTMIINTIMIVVLVNYGVSIIIVKFLSSIIFVFRPIFMWLYVKKHFGINKPTSRDQNALSQKWTALGQHIAFFLHSNTDIAVLTIFGNLTLVAIYSVYNMIVSAIQNLASSFSAGMEAIFGDMIAKNENQLLNKTFGYYDTLISIVSVSLFGTCGAMIIPFVKIYTLGVSDANYIEPAFAILLIIASLLYCLRLPYHSIIIAAGHFSQTKKAGYGEAIINISLSIILVINFGLIGVAIGTVCAVAFRFIYYVLYISHTICNRSPILFIKRIATNAVSFSLIFLIGVLLANGFGIDGYPKWIIAGACVFLISVCINAFVNVIVYKKDFYTIMQNFSKQKRS